MNHWINVELGNICEIVRGASPRPITDYITDKPDGVNWLKIGDVKETDKYFLHANEKIKPLGISKTREVKTGDLILSNSMSFGRAFITLIDGYIHDGWLRLRCDESKLDKEYLYYFLKSNLAQDQFKAIATGSVVNNLKSDTVKSIRLSLPPLEVQRKIASILTLFDNKIKSNTDINENLEQQAQSLYAHAFQYATSDTLPDGWRLGTVGEIIEIHDSKRIPLSGAQRTKMEKKIYPYYGAASLMDYVDDYLFDGKYLLLGEDGTVVDDSGFPILQYVWGQFWVNNHAHILTGKLGYNVESLYMLFKQTPVKSIVTGAVQPKISQANLKSIPVVIPPINLIEEFNKQVDEMFTLIRNNEDENECLVALRDSLLPKLMSGEIDVCTLTI